MRSRPALLLLLLAACGGYREAPMRVADRARPATSGTFAAAVATPDPRGARVQSTFGHTKTTAAVLTNGVRVVLLERHDLPIVAMTVAIARGRADERPGAVDILFDLLERGPKSRKPSIWEYFGWLGARSSTFVEREVSGITFEVLSSHTTSLVLTAGEMFEQATYDSELHDEHKRSVIARLRTWRTGVDNAGTQAVLTSLGLVHQPEPDAVDKITVDDVERAYGGLVAPDAMVLSVVGDFDSAQMKRVLEKAFGGAKGKAKPAVRAVPAPNQDRFVLLDRAKGEQTAILIATPAPRIGEADAASFQLACAVLGIRLEDATRLAKGYTYGADASCPGFAPYLKITVDVTAARTKEALTDVLHAIESLQTQPATKNELAWARSWMARSFTSRFTTNVDTSTELARAVAAGLSPDALATLFDDTGTVTPESLVAVSQKWLKDLHVVVLGDATAITGDISSVGLGQPIVRSMP